LYRQNHRLPRGRIRPLRFVRLRVGDQHLVEGGGGGVHDLLVAEDLASAQHYEVALVVGFPLVGNGVHRVVSGVGRAVERLL